MEIGTDREHEDSPFCWCRPYMGLGTDQILYVFHMDPLAELLQVIPYDPMAYGYLTQIARRPVDYKDGAD